MNLHLALLSNTDTYSDSSNVKVSLFLLEEEE
jgi:hypothetical protein